MQGPVVTSANGQTFKSSQIRTILGLHPCYEAVVLVYKTVEFCTKIESNYQKTFYCIVLYINMAAVTSDAKKNQQTVGPISQPFNVHKLCGTLKIPHTIQ